MYRRLIVLPNPDFLKTPVRGRVDMDVDRFSHSFVVEMNETLGGKWRALLKTHNSFYADRKKTISD